MSNTKIPSVLEKASKADLQARDQTIMESLSPEELRAYISLMGPDMDDCYAVVKGADEFIKCPYYDTSKDKCLYEKTESYDKMMSCTDIIGNYLNFTEDDADALEEYVEDLKDCKKLGKKRFHGLFK